LRRRLTPASSGTHHGIKWTPPMASRRCKWTWEVVWYPSLWLGILEFILEFHRSTVWLPRNWAVISFRKSSKMYDAMGKHNSELRPAICVSLWKLFTNWILNSAIICNSCGSQTSVHFWNYNINVFISKCYKRNESLASKRLLIYIAQRLLIYIARWNVCCTCGVSSLWTCVYMCVSDRWRGHLV
jgi:hypothetical protein